MSIEIMIEEAIEAVRKGERQEELVGRAPNYAQIAQAKALIAIALALENMDVNRIDT